MQFEKFKEQIKAIDFDSVRADAEDYYEAVINSSQMADLSSCLEKVLGKPAFPSENPLSDQAKDIITEFGGLRQGQTFYFLNQDGNSIFVMLWPWSDGEHTTLKSGQK